MMSLPGEGLRLDALRHVRIRHPAVAFAGLDELQGEHQPEASDVADRAVLRGERAQAGQELGAALAGVGDEALVLDHVERRVRRRAGDDVAAVRPAVGAGRPLVDHRRAARSAR